MCGGGWTLTALFFYFNGRGFILQNLGSTFFSYVVGKRVGGQKMSNAKCDLLCGTHRLRFNFVYINIYAYVS